MQRFLVTVKRMVPKQTALAVHELVERALSEIPGSKDVYVTRHSEEVAEASFTVVGERLTPILDRHLKKFGLTWLSLQLLDPPPESDGNTDD